MQLNCVAKQLDVDVYGSALDKFDDCQVVKPDVKYTIYLEEKSYGISSIYMNIDECVGELEDAEDDNKTMEVDIKDFEIYLDKEPDDEFGFHLRNLVVDLDKKTVEAWL